MWDVNGRRPEDDSMRSEQSVRMPWRCESARPRGDA